MTITSQPQPLIPHVESAIRQNRVSDETIARWLLIAASLLAVAQLLVGTAPYFAIGIYATLTTAIVSLRIIGFASIAGLMIANCMFRYLVFSQIVKTLLGQPGDSNLAAPDTTIGVMFIGTLSICFAAIVVARFIGNRRIISVPVTPAALAKLRDISLVFGAILSATEILSGGPTEVGAESYGGFLGFARQFSQIIDLAILAETWRLLMLSNGKRSTSTVLCVLIAAFALLGITFNSKARVAEPFLLYFMACFGYRRFISGRQLILAGILMLAGVFVIYPTVNMMRGRIDTTHSAMAVAGEMIEQAIDDPGALVAEWDEINTVPVQDRSIMEQKLFYTGDTDALMQRFMLISTTDAIVSAVDDYGLYGVELITAGFELAMPTVLAPNKQRISTGDLLTWHYGLVSEGVVTFTTIGLYADCYAALGWLGIVIIPASLMVCYLTLVQVFGTSCFNNILGLFFLFLGFLGFGERNIQSYVISIVKTLPIYIGLIVLIVFLANKFFMPRRHVVSSRHEDRQNVTADHP
jgi:hypothetical protein